MAPSFKHSKPKTRQTVAKPLRLKGAKPPKPQGKERQTRSGAGPHCKVANKSWNKKHPQQQKEANNWPKKRTTSKAAKSRLKNQKHDMQENKESRNPRT